MRTIGRPPEDERHAEDAAASRRPAEREGAERADQAAHSDGLRSCSRPRSRSRRGRETPRRRSGRSGSRERRPVRAMSPTTMRGSASARESRSRRRGRRACSLPARGRHSKRPFDPDGSEEKRRARQRAGADGEDDAHVCDRDEHAGEERPDQGSEALDRRRRAVRADQLLGRPRERGQHRLLGWSNEGDERPTTAASAKIAGTFSPTKKATADPAQPRRRARSRRGSAHAGSGRRARRRRARRARRAAGERAGDPDPTVPPCVVGEDAERDEVRPLGR